LRSLLLLDVLSLLLDVLVEEFPAEASVLVELAFDVMRSRHRSSFGDRPISGERHGNIVVSSTKPAACSAGPAAASIAMVH
jgi:hypothetical protein